MKYYKNTAGGVFAYESHAEREHYGTPDLVPLNAAEVESHLNPPAQKPTREQVEIARLMAYSDPVKGSDRYRAEAEAERLQGNDEVAAIAEQKMLARRAEIQSENPWPGEE